MSARGCWQQLDHAKIPNISNIAAEWKNVPWDPGRAHSVPWQWGSVGIAGNTSVYDGDPNTSVLFLDPPEEMIGKIYIVPERNDVLNMAVVNAGGEACTEDLTLLRTVRGRLKAAKPKSLSMDCGTTEKLSSGDYAASVNMQRQSTGMAQPCGHA
jgi:spermidine/putrescine transport system substrate-binding protein